MAASRLHRRATREYVVSPSGTLAPLARHTARVIPYRAVLACLGLSVAAILAFSWSTATPTSVRAARTAAFLIAIAAGYTQDDTAREITSSVCTSLGRRRLQRLTVAGPVFAAVWALDVWLTSRLIGPVPVADLTTELLAFTAAALVLNVLIAPHMPEQQGGIAVAPVLLVCYLGAGLAYQPLLTSGAEEPGWAAAHRIFASVVVVCAVGFALATWWSTLRWRLPMHRASHRITATSPLRIRR